MGKIGIKLLGIMLTATLLVILQKSHIAYGEEKYITVEDFASELAKEIELEDVNGDGVNALKNAGIIKDGDFNSYSAYLTRGDATMLLNRADEYLFGDNIDPGLVRIVIEKRISDINKISMNKREDIAKGYIKGFMKGYSNGTYCTDRELRGSKKITRAGALNTIKMIKNKELRAKISPDGQLIRTTNLPQNADYYEYILASYPNKYYDLPFNFEGMVVLDLEKGFQSVEEEKKYTIPKDVNELLIYDRIVTGYKDDLIDGFIESAQIYLKTLFNVDYRTIGNGSKFIEKIEDVITSMPDYEKDYVVNSIDHYVKKIKENKTIIESDGIHIDGSTLYRTINNYYLRGHAKIRINTNYRDNNLFSWQEEDSIVSLYNDFIYQVAGYLNRSDYPIDNTIKVGEWKDFYFDIKFKYGTNENSEHAEWLISNPEGIKGLSKESRY